MRSPKAMAAPDRRSLLVNPTSLLKLALQAGGIRNELSNSTFFLFQ